MEYTETLPNQILIVPTHLRYTEQLETLQRKVFPTLAEDELLHADQYWKHVEIFPEGQFIALDSNKDKVVGATTSMRVHYNISDPHPHSFKEIMGGGWLSTHDPNGEWLYGLDMSVDPDYRQMGISRSLYRARQYTCTYLGLKGQVIVGMLNGFGAKKEEMTLDDYYEGVKKDEIFDPTVSVQRKIGFEIVTLMKEYLHDPRCGNAGVMMMLPAEKKI